MKVPMKTEITASYIENRLFMDVMPYQKVFRSQNNLALYSEQLMVLLAEVLNQESKKEALHEKD